VKVGIATYTPMEDNNWSSSVQVQGEPDLNKGASFVKCNAEYFDSVGMIQAKKLAELQALSPILQGGTRGGQVGQPSGYFLDPVRTK